MQRKGHETWSLHAATVKAVALSWEACPSSATEMASQGWAPVARCCLAQPGLPSPSCISAKLTTCNNVCKSRCCCMRAGTNYYERLLMAVGVDAYKGKKTKNFSRDEANHYACLRLSLAAFLIFPLPALCPLNRGFSINRECAIQPLTFLREHSPGCVATSDSQLPRPPVWQSGPQPPRPACLAPPAAAAHPEALTSQMSV